MRIEERMKNYIEFVYRDQIIMNQEFKNMNVDYVLDWVSEHYEWGDGFDVCDAHLYEMIVDGIILYNLPKDYDTGAFGFDFEKKYSRWENE